MSSSHAVQACLNALQTYLSTNVAGLTVLKEWPSANQKLTYPSLTLFSGKVTTMNRAPELLSTGAVLNNQITATEVIGEHDFKMQCDLWCRNKLERDTFLGAIEDAINKPSTSKQGLIGEAGLSLQLTDYYNDWVRYEIDGSQYVDDEAAAERQERRVKLDLLVNCRAIRTRTYYAMGTIETYVGAESDASGMSDDISNTDIDIV